MLIWAALFAGSAIVSAIFGFTEIAEASAGIARILCAIFASLSVFAIALHLANWRKRQSIQRQPSDET